MLHGWIGPYCPPAATQNSIGPIQVSSSGPLKEKWGRNCKKCWYLVRLPLIMGKQGGRGIQNVKISGSKLFAHTPMTSRQGKTFLHPYPTVLLKLQAPTLKLPQNCWGFPSAWLKPFHLPFFCRGKGKAVLARPPPSYHVLAPPLPIINSRPLKSTMTSTNEQYKITSFNVL